MGIGPLELFGPSDAYSCKVQDNFEMNVSKITNNHRVGCIYGTQTHNIGSFRFRTPPHEAKQPASNGGSLSTAGSPGASSCWR